MPNDPDILTVARAALKMTIGGAYVPMHPEKLRPLSDSELGKEARRLVPKFAQAVIYLSAENAAYLSEEMTYGQPRLLDARIAELEKQIVELKGKQ